MQDLFPNIQEINSKKKAWLDYLFYEIGKQAYNYKICSLNKGQNDERISSKWITYMEAVASLNINEHWKLKHYNQRQILPNEVVLDLEDKTKLDLIIHDLIERKQKFYVFDTHSRGVHINIFFNKKLSQKRKQVIITFFGADQLKSADNTMIALEFSKHWKSGQVKELISYYV
jgi:hypothetical protein